MSVHETDDRTVTPHEMRRALARAGRGASLDVREAAALLAARGEDLAALCAVAGRVRDAGLVAAGHPGVVTYSPKVFIALTRLSGPVPLLQVREHAEPAGRRG